MKYRRSIALSAIPLLVIAGLFGYHYLWPADETLRLPVVEDCALHLESCSVSFPQGGSMRLTIDPKRPSPTDTLRLNASFEQIAPQVVGVRFKGVDMNMGYLEHFVYDLQKQDSGENRGSFGGDAGVFACSRNLMQWRVLVKVQAGNRRYEVPFKFETSQPG